MKPAVRFERLSEGAHPVATGRLVIAEVLLAGGKYLLASGCKALGDAYGRCRRYLP